MTRRIVITGAGTGIGAATARRLAARDVRLHLVGRRREPLESVAGQVPDAVVHTCDLRDPVAVSRLAATIAEDGPVDGLFLNAGGNAAADPDLDGLAAVADGWRENFDLNVLTTVLLTEALLPHLSRPGGRIVGMSSVAAQRGAGAYGAAKAAVIGWMYWMSGRVAADGITVNCVAPGFVPDTEFWTEALAADPGLTERKSAEIPVGRPGTPAEVAEAVAYLLSPDAGWTTGQVLGLSGGLILGR